MLKRLRAAGPVLLVDAGNALFELPGGADDLGKSKAELILRAMGDLKTSAMAAGERDLSLGPDFLAQAAGRAGVPVLSANLSRDGKPLFPASTVVTAGGVKVGLVGLSPVLPMDRFPGVRVEPPVKAALEEARKLRGKVDLLVALAATSFADSLQLSKEGGALFDLVLMSGERRALGSMQRSDQSYLLGSGERGRAIGALELDLAASGPLVDLADLDRTLVRKRNLEAQVQEVRRRSTGERDPAVLASYQRALASFQEQIQQLRAQDPEGRAKGARTVQLLIHSLDEAVADDPELKAQVVKLQPNPTPH